jgi:hypothetical protein
MRTGLDVTKCSQAAPNLRAVSPALALEHGDRTAPAIQAEEGT